MSGVTGFEFSTATVKESQRVEEAPFVMMVLGDFGGNAARAEDDDPAWLMQVPVRNVDIDTIGGLWKAFQPRLEMDIGGTAIALEPRDLDDFHPDQLYLSQPLFADLRDLRKRLLDPATSDAALAEVLESGTGAEDQAPEAEAAVEPAAPESGENMFERLLGERTARPSPAAAASSRLDNLLHRVVGPHIVHELDPKVDTAVDAVDKAVAESMRQILHHPDFQALEGAWRSLYELVHEAEIGGELHLKICSLSKNHLLRGLPASAESMEESGLYQLLVGRFRRAADDVGFSLLVCNYFFGGGADDVALLATLSTLAEQHGAAVLGAALSELIGSHSLAEQPAAGEWSKLDNPFWQRLRESPQAGRIGLVLPRLLGRMPYGRDTEAVESFDFEELDTHEHEKFLWVNPALACAGLLAQSFTASGWNMSAGDHTDIGGLPVFTYTLEGEKKMLPCAELLLPERSAEAILELGIMPIVSFRNRDMARLLRFQSISKPISGLLGPWS